MVWPHAKAPLLINSIWSLWRKQLHALPHRSSSVLGELTRLPAASAFTAARTAQSLRGFLVHLLHYFLVHITKTKKSQAVLFLIQCLCFISTRVGKNSWNHSVTSFFWSRPVFWQERRPNRSRHHGRGNQWGWSSTQWTRVPSAKGQQGHRWLLGEYPTDDLAMWRGKTSTCLLDFFSAIGFEFRMTNVIFLVRLTFYLYVS